MALHTDETGLTEGKKPIERLLPVLPFVIGGASFFLVMLKGLHKGDTRGFKPHHHEALAHT